jgi:hypothetical protein
MSAFRWLVFVLGVIVIATFGAILNEIVLPTISMTQSLSSTQASATGATWLSQAWTWMPLIVMLLLMFGLVYGIVVRRRSVVP